MTVLWVRGGGKLARDDSHLDYWLPVWAGRLRVLVRRPVSLSIMGRVLGIPVLPYDRRHYRKGLFIISFLVMGQAPFLVLERAAALEATPKCKGIIYLTP